MFRSNFLIPVSGIIFAIAMSGCASTSGSTSDSEAARRLQESETRVAVLEREASQSEGRINELTNQLASNTLPAVSSAPATRISNTSQYNQIPGGDLLPPAEPGQCYARVFIPPTYETQSEEVLKRGATESLSITPATYETVEEEVLVQAASSRIEVIPAVLGWAEEQVLVKAAATRLEEVPATYEWREEQVLVKAAHTTWKKGTGPIQKVDSGTGEIMCLVEVPAEYKTVKVRNLKTPAREQRTPIAAEYQTVSKRVQVTDGEMAWRQILCETNTTAGLVQNMQRALAGAGHSPGPIDGIVGHQTLAAVKSYQDAKGLARGCVTLATLKSLGVQ